MGDPFLIPVVLAGGAGTRLWPLSRTTCPKQFLSLHGDGSLLQQTLQRLEGLCEQPPVILCNEAHRFLVMDQLQQRHAEILIEPQGRDTAPAIALAALRAMQSVQSGEEAPLLLVLSADQVIDDVAAFHTAVRQLMPAVQAGKFGTIGITPDAPATEYGYIRLAEALANGVHAVQHFVEKPDQQRAQRYLDSGDYLWNSGMFLIRADRYLEEMARFQPQMLQACEQAMAGVQEDLGFLRVNTEAFLSSPADSIDYALLEPMTELDDEAVVVTQLDGGWNDLGSWSALWEVASKDALGNATLGAGEVIHQDTRDSLVFSDQRLVTTLGMDNTVIVDTADALLVARKDQVQAVKQIVAQVQQAGRSEHHQHREVFRPWGKYDAIDRGQRYQVKRITVNPGARLSLQKHHHRAEHWIVVSGTAEVTNGDQTYLVTENESTYIPIGQLHSLANPGVIPLEIIEVQSGAYLGEDDIVRMTPYS
jgi:mannose-1-phosphate guanylyltransferase